MKHLQQSPGINEPTTYQIRVKGRLDESWSDWFDGMVIGVENGSSGSDVTTITGRIVDQAALHGILNRIRDLNLPLLSVQLIKPGYPTQTPSQRNAGRKRC